MSSGFEIEEMRHVGFDVSVPNGPCAYFPPNVVQYIQQQVLQRSKCQIPQGVLVPNHIIKDVLSQEYSNLRPPTGDIYSRYILPTTDPAVNSSYWDLINRTINTILQTSVNTLQLEKANLKYSAWDQVLGTFNRHGIRSHDVIKVRDKRPTTGIFNWNY